jgi:hypothetical protein
MARKSKGGNFIQPQMQQYQQQPYQYQQQPYQYQQQQQPYQQQQQTNYTGMIGDTMKTMQPVYDATASIGIAYSIFSTVMATIICAIGIYVGFWVKNLDASKTAKTVGTVKEADCTKTKKDKSCVATITYKVNDIEYSVSSSTGLVNKGQNIDIYYDPKNPNNFVSNSYTNIIGWVIIIVCIILLLSSWGWLIMTLLFKPVAAASGVGAVAGAVMPGNGNGNGIGIDTNFY